MSHKVGSTVMWLKIIILMSFKKILKTLSLYLHNK